jgi:DNA polymerase-4
MNLDGEHWEGRAVIHLDMDAFFAAIEQLDHPEWRGKPVIVGGSADGRGVVSTASYEARVFGVRSAMSSALAARLCPDAIWTSGNHERYREVSKQVMAVLADFSPRVEQVSVDEAYMDVTPGRHEDRSPVLIARDIQARVAALGLSCSIGLATGKTVAKIASDRDKPAGLTVVMPGEEAAFLGPLPVGVLPGVGPKTALALKSIGIRTLGELAELEPRSATQALGSHGAGLVERAAGIDTRPVGGHRDAKSISGERTFATDVRDKGEAEAAVTELAARVARRLRRAESVGRTITLKLRYSDFTTRTVSRTVDVPVDLDGEVAAVAVSLLRSAWTPGTGLRLLGVGVSGLGTLAHQLEFGEVPDDAEETPARQRALAEGLDKVRDRFGPGAIRRGASGVERARPPRETE